jgi:glycerophosphoryl diester phosphodiesterase
MLRALVVIALVLPAVAARGVPMNVGHRGYSVATPENTLTAERRAFDVGADMVELDLQKSSDGYVVVIHDDTVGRTTDSLTDDRVDSLTLSELRALDAGYPDRFGSEFAGERIPTLEEILEEAKGRGPLLLDQKSSLLFGAEIAAALATTAFPLDQVWVTVWNQAQVADIQLHVPSARILWTQGAPSIWEATMDDFLDQMEAFGVDGISVVFENYTFSAPGLAAATQERGLLAFAWNFEQIPDTPEKMQTAIEIGLDGYIVNDPETFANIITEPPLADAKIDIKPGSDPNSIHPFSRGVIPVAILTTEDFDALTVDADSVLFGPDEAEKRHKQAHVEDVDGDGDLDLLLHFRTQDTGMALGDTEGCVIGQTYDGVPIEGCDSVRTVPPGGSGVSTTVSSTVSRKNCGLGAELALLLPPLMWLHRRRGRRA